MNILQSIFYNFTVLNGASRLILHQTLHLLKQQIDFSNPSQFNTSKLINIVYFDAFAPEKQPEMWTSDVFNKIFSLCDKGAILTTYCAKGVVRRMMQNVGFQIKRLPGPPGKREILRGEKCI